MCHTYNKRANRKTPVLLRYYCLWTDWPQEWSVGSMVVG